ncbi:serine protease inhibitor [Lentinula aciculospora]|uniref:Serine protease inhibitor n=1 Tax=Lentinula aciculospora TaxID=153920 RepID=A0A9W9A3S4_9AGAR|nr:serine protease inhibitor [Lentinula aciculospora]
MSLTTGRYLIKNEDNVVGRALAEDLSLQPKRIILLPPDDKTSTPASLNLHDNEYIIISNGSPTAHIENHIFALLIDRGAATKWLVQAVPQHGENAFIITTAARQYGWSAPGEANEQIGYSRLVVGRSLPPRYSPHQVFQITKAE